VSNIFRDATEGTNAKRQDLLRRRRDEFITMPHAIRRVFVARRARIAASIAVCLTGTALIVTALSPSLARTIASGMPGLNPAVLSTLVIAMWVTGLVAYTWSRAMGEHAFLVEMSRTVMPTDNLDDDVERLAHEHPDEVARGMAHRLEVRSAALPIVAAGMLLPVTALYALYGVRAGGWPVIADFETSVAAHAGILTASAVAGVAAGIFMTKKLARVSALVPIAGAIAIVCGLAAVMIARWLAIPALLAGTMTLVVWRLGKERDLLDTDDPAAGSEVFTFRGFLREVRTVLGKTRAVVRRATVKQLAVLAGLAFAAAGILAYATDSSDGAKATAASGPMMKPMTIREPVVAKSGSKYRMEPTGDGGLRIEITLADDQPLDVPFSGVAQIPHGWTARVNIILDAYELEGGLDPITVTAFPGDLTAAPQGLDDSKRDVTFSQSACDTLGHSLGLRVQSPKPGTFTFVVRPVLEPAGC
jgi:hypothetical protein